MHLSGLHIPISRECGYFYCVYWYAKIIVAKVKHYFNYMNVLVFYKVCSEILVLPIPINGITASLNIFACKKIF